MIFKKLRYLLEKLFNIHIRFVKKNIYKNLETPDIDIIKSIARSSGVLHIGGHRGSERFTYDWMGKKVIWIEANPIIFRELKSNLKEFKYQQCYQALLHSTKGKWLDFFLSSNDQASSSIYDFSKTFKNNDLFFQNIKKEIFQW